MTRCLQDRDTGNVLPHLSNQYLNWQQYHPFQDISSWFKSLELFKATLLFGVVKRVKMAWKLPKKTWQYFWVARKKTKPGGGGSEGGIRERYGKRSYISYIFLHTSRPRTLIHSCLCINHAAVFQFRIFPVLKNLSNIYYRCGNFMLFISASVTAFILHK